MCCLEVSSIKISSLHVSSKPSIADAGGEGRITYHVKGMINPLNIFSLGKLEKLAELCDQIYHLSAPLVIPYVNASMKEMLIELHHSVHHIEHLLHAFCFIEDVRRLVYCIKKGQFVEHVKGKINYLRLAGRICHGTAHFFATANLLSEILGFGEFQRLFKCATLIAALGHALLTASVLHYYKDWYIRTPDQHLSIYQHPYIPQVIIHISGFFFEALPWIEDIPIIAPYAKGIQKVTAIIGIVHAWFVVNQGQTVKGEGPHSLCHDKHH